MRITFLLPGYSSSPVGGFRVVYEYANRLQRRGHQVVVVHPHSLKPQVALLQRAKTIAWKARIRVLHRSLVPWFPVHPDVRLLLTPDLRAQFIPQGDAIFATAWQTAPWVNRYSRAKGKKYYLVQHYETWSGPKNEVDATWKMPLHKVVISRWLWDLGVAFGEVERMTYIQNGIDTKQFRLLSPIESRNPHRIGMLYHTAKWKGTADGIAALTHVRQNVPNIDVVFFGAPPRTYHVPSWITYVEKPHGEELVQLYNSFATFLHPSWAEGWGLPAAEAMACGCALVAAGNGGVMDFIREDKTALVAPIKDPKALADLLLRLLKDDTLRQRLAAEGHQSMQPYTWARAVDAMENLLKGDQLAAMQD